VTPPITSVEDRGWRLGVLAAVTVGAGVVTVLLPPIPQDLAYHDFADRRTVLGLQHGLNVLSNVGFLLAGGWALVRVLGATLPTWERVAGLIFAVGLLLTGLGSAWYHAAPTKWHLIDDLRPYAVAQFLPMLLIPLMLILLPGRRPAASLVAGIALYAVGKAAELADRVVLAAGGVVSGHTLKHLLAAAAAAVIVVWLTSPSRTGTGAWPR